jgi:hypothetical protein
MPSDRSRTTDLPRNGYTNPVAQQGRVILDRDFNAGQGLTAARIAADALDFVGPCGTPDDGFRISFPVGSPPLQPFWSPPVTPPPESPPVSPGGAYDFLIAPGTMYVGGQRAIFYGEQEGAVITYSYFDQPDWPAPPQPTPGVQHELIYLDLVEQEVSAVEDPDLLEVALGGPDTTQRLKLLRRVRRLSVSATDCVTAWDIAVKRWAASGWEFNPSTMQLVPAARLKVGFTQDASAGDPCDPVATGGYVGADNQMIRVRIAGPKAAPKVVWGYDNASFLYPVTVSPDGITLTPAFDPPDAAHIPQKGQVVEILQTAAVLGTEPQTEPSGQKTVMRVAADLDGTLRKLVQPYGPPSTGGTGNVYVLDSALPAEVSTSTLPLFLRVWQAEVDAPLNSKAELKDPASGIITGVAVTVSSVSGPALADGAFWQIAVRPSTPQEVYPESLQTEPQPPDGPRRWVCPLAIIDWTNLTIADCRNQFDNLVTLSGRKSGCCTIAIAPSDVGGATTLQGLIDHAVSLERPATVCLRTGRYVLPRPLRLSSDHQGITLESCGGPAQLIADETVNPQVFADGLVVLTGTDSVTLRGLSLEVPYGPIEIPGLLGLRPSIGFGIRAVNSKQLTLEHCAVDVTKTRAEGIDLFTAAIFLEGDCSDISVNACEFSSKIPLTYTPLRSQQGATTLGEATMPTGGSTVLNDALDRFRATLMPSSPPLDEPTLLDSRVQASMDVLIAALPPATRRPVVATAGIVALDVHPRGGSRVSSRLGTAAIDDNVFTGLTFATLLAPEAIAVRLQDNTVMGGVAGLWFGLSGSTTPTSLAKGTDISTYYPSILEFAEFTYLTMLLMIYPIPSSGAGGQSDGGSTESNFTLFVIGNEVRLMGAASGSVTLASAALLLQLNVPKFNGALIGDLSAIISANRFYTVAGELAPAALVVLPSAQPCAITGNGIVNAQGVAMGPAGSGQGRTFSEDPRSASLWLMIQDSDVTHEISVNDSPDSQSNTVLLSVTGNALCGTSDLHFLQRGDANTRSGWSPYNADPT